MQFQILMKHLFRHMGVEMPSEMENDVYAVTVDGMQTLRLFCAPAETLNLIAVIAPLPEPADCGYLLNVLKLNSFTPLFSEFNFKVGLNQASGNIELWLYETMSGMTPEKLIALFDMAVEMSAYVRSWTVEAPLDATFPERVSAYASIHGRGT